MIAAQETIPQVFGSDNKTARPLGRSIRRGLLNTCPACGSGKLFRAFLKPVDHCAACNEAMHHHRADDLPPYIVVVILGHVMLGGYMMTDMLIPSATWIHLAIWIPASVLIALLMIQPIKGGVIGLQWALRMHGFGGEPDVVDSIDGPTRKD